MSAGDELKLHSLLVNQQRLLPLAAEKTTSAALECKKQLHTKLANRKEGNKQ
jgi:hypothetical protein